MPAHRGPSARASRAGKGMAHVPRDLDASDDRVAPASPSRKTLGARIEVGPSRPCADPTARTSDRARESREGLSSHTAKVVGARRAEGARAVRYALPTTSAAPSGGESSRRCNESSHGGRSAARRRPRRRAGAAPRLLRWVDMDNTHRGDEPGIEPRSTAARTRAASRAPGRGAWWSGLLREMDAAADPRGPIGERADRARAGIPACGGRGRSLQ